MRAAWRRLDSRAGKIGAVLFLALVATALTAPWLAPHDPYAQNVIARLKPPFWMAGALEGHPLGTDALGRDTLSRLIHGARISLGISAMVVFGAGLLGTALGLIAGYFGGWIDDVISLLVNAAWSFPFILLALIIVAVLGSGVGNLIVALVATSWAAFARIARGEAMALRDQEYVTAARSLGMRDVRILLRHVMPNLAGSMLVVGSIEFGRAILRESFLSFLGLGVPPSVPSWGGMLAEARAYLFTMDWMVTLPGIMIFLATLSVNLFGDGLRDALDPRLRRRR